MCSGSEGGAYLRLIYYCITQLLREGFVLTESVYTVILQKSIPAEIRQRILYISNNKGCVDEFVGESTFAKRRQTHFL